MADNADLRAIFTSLLTVLESQQRQIDELLERQLSIEGAAKTLGADFEEAREEVAAEVSNATQYPLAQKADKYSELLQSIHRRLR